MRPHPIRPPAWMISLLTVTALLAPRLAAQTVDLRPKLVEGNSTWYETVQTSTSAMRSPSVGIDREETSSLTTRMRLTTVEIDPNGGGEMEAVIDRVTVKSPIGGGADFDSDTTPDTDAGNPIAPAMRTLVDHPITLRVDAEGIITEIRGLEGLFPRGPTGAALNGMFGPDAMKQMFQPVVATGSGRNSARRVGSSWSTTSELNLPTGKVKMNATHTLREVAGSIARVTIKGSLDSADGLTDALGLTIKHHSYSGEYRWDLETGEAASITVDQRMEFVSDRQGLEMDMAVTSKIKTTRIPEPDGR